MCPSPEAETGPATEAWKRMAAERALALVRDGMVIGLGTGSTAAYFIQGVGRLVASGMRLHAVPTSSQTARQAGALGIPLLDGIDRPLDVAVDGADEIDPERNCIKGRGGALLKEKVVAQAARRFVLIADHSKLVTRLGRGAVAIEILPFLWTQTSRRLEDLGGRPALRGGPQNPYRTENGNLILDTSFGAIGDPAALDRALHAVAGVIEHGIFVGVACSAIVAGERGIQVLGESVSEA